MAPDIIAALDKRVNLHLRSALASHQDLRSIIYVDDLYCVRIMHRSLFFVYSGFNKALFGVSSVYPGI